MNPDSVTASGDDALIGDYLSRVRKAAWYLPRERRDWVLRQVGDHLADAMEAQDPGAPDPESQDRQAQDRQAQDPRGAMAELGEPKAVVRAIDGHAPGAEARWLEYVAVLLILIGGLFDGIGWLLGVVLLWSSPRWRWQDKLLASLVWPGGLLLTRQLMNHYLLGQLIPSAGFVLAPRSAGGGFFPRPSSLPSYLISVNLGHPALEHLAILLLAALPPVLIAIRLLRVARGPELPQVPAPGQASARAPAGEPGRS